MLWWAQVLDSLRWEYDSEGSEEEGQALLASLLHRTQSGEGEGEGEGEEWDASRGYEYESGEEDEDILSQVRGASMLILQNWQRELQCCTAKLKLKLNAPRDSLMHLPLS